MSRADGAMSGFSVDISLFSVVSCNPSSVCAHEAVPEPWPNVEVVTSARGSE